MIDSVQFQDDLSNCLAYFTFLGLWIWKWCTEKEWQDCRAATCKNFGLGFTESALRPWEEQVARYWLHSVRAQEKTNSIWCLVGAMSLHCISYYKLITMLLSDRKVVISTRSPLLEVWKISLLTLYMLSQLLQIRAASCDLWKVCTFRASSPSRYFGMGNPLWGFCGIQTTSNPLLGANKVSWILLAHAGQNIPTVDPKFALRQHVLRFNLFFLALVKFVLLIQTYQTWSPKKTHWNSLLHTVPCLKSPPHPEAATLSICQTQGLWRRRDLFKDSIRLFVTDW